MTTASSALPSGFQQLAWSNLAVQAAEQIALAVAPIIVLSLGAGIRETGLLQTAQTLPLLFLSIPAGVLADRISRRRLMAGREALRALSLLAVVWAPSIWLAGLAFFLVGTGPILWVSSAPSPCASGSRPSASWGASRPSS